jgi:hypothetical protein
LNLFSATERALWNQNHLAGGRKKLDDKSIQFGRKWLGGFVPTRHPAAVLEDNWGQRRVERLDLKVDRRPQWRFEGYPEGREVKARTEQSTPS